MRIPVTVIGEAGRIDGEIIAIYTRETIARPTEAPTVRNSAHTVFNTNPAIGRVVVVMASLIPIFLIEVGHSWFDVTAQPVRLKRREATQPGQPGAIPVPQNAEPACLNR
jgi:hypothetical protein